MKLIIDVPDEIVKKGFEGPLTDEERMVIIRAVGNATQYKELQGDTITNDDLQAAMTESYRLGYELAETKFKRPQGEWILQYRSCGDRYYTCSKCNRAIEVKNDQSLKDYPFCHCGAAMGGNTDEFT